MMFALWSSCKKPHVDVFLNESLSQLRSLIGSSTTVFVGNQQFRIALRTQCLIADMSAKSLFLKFIHFNGQNACCRCESRSKAIFLRDQIEKLQPVLQDIEIGFVERFSIDIIKTITKLVVIKRL